MSTEPYLPLLNPCTPDTKQFHVFTSLPKDLQLLIWQHASHIQRIVIIRLSDPWLEDPRIPASVERNKALNSKDTEVFESHTVGHYIVSTAPDPGPVYDDLGRLYTGNRGWRQQYYRFQRLLYDLKLPHKNTTIRFQSTLQYRAGLYGKKGIRVIYTRHDAEIVAEARLRERLV
jgi:hypothetical protein